MDCENIYLKCVNTDKIIKESNTRISCKHNFFSNYVSDNKKNLCESLYSNCKKIKENIMK